VPEGDVVLRTARRLHAALAGRELVTSDLRWPSLATSDLTGRPVLEVVAVGKHLLTRIGGDLTLHSHLKMEGSWHVHRTGARPSRRPATDGVRAILANTRWTTVGYRLGMLDLVPTDREHGLVGHLGPDILGPDWASAAATVVDRIAVQPDRTIGEALLDQRMLAGIGTFYLCETCFLRGVHPWTPVAAVPDLPGLVALAHRLISANVERAVQVTTGDARPGRREWVHSRSGLPCRRCGRTIRVAPLGAAPRERVAFWCPNCQPGDVPTDPVGPQRPLGAIGGRRTSPGSGYRRSSR
jgi:endonuclease-8